MPEPGMGANNDHSSRSVGSSSRGSSSGNDNSSSSKNTTAENISSSNTTAENLSKSESKPESKTPTTSESLSKPPTTAETLTSTATHGYDEVPSVALSKYTPAEPSSPTQGVTPGSLSRTPTPAAVPNEYADLFGATPNPVGGVDAVWANGDGTFSSSDGSTYDPTTGKGNYDPGEDSFAVTHSSIGVTLDGKMVQTTERHRHPDRVRTSESLALVEHDPKRLASAHGNRVAFDYYNNPNMDSIRDEALMHAAAAANKPVSGRYPGENLAYISVFPMTAHLARSIRLAPTSRFHPNQRTPAQYESLARDPAHNGKIFPKSEREREIGLGFERSGEVRGPIRRDPTGRAEFIDAQGQSWDVKAFNSNFPANKGGFNLARDARKVDNELQAGENVMLDTQNLSRADLHSLQQEAIARGWGDRVKFW